MMQPCTHEFTSVDNTPIWVRLDRVLTCKPYPYPLREEPYDILEGTLIALDVQNEFTVREKYEDVKDILQKFHSSRQFM